MPLPDLLAPNLKVVFVGTAVTASSNAAAAYYATHGNKFYQVLHQVGITQNLITPQDYRLLVNQGVGLTDLVKGRDALDHELYDHDFGITSFNDKMLEYNPQIICFNGKLAAAYFLFGNKKTHLVHYGRHADLLGNSIIYVAPSTAQTANKYWDVGYYIQLTNLINELNSQ
jgi:TDG/mug DNA glycosylase family protein